MDLSTLIYCFKEFFIYKFMFIIMLPLQYDTVLRSFNELQCKQQTYNFPLTSLTLMLSSLI